MAKKYKWVRSLTGVSIISPSGRTVLWGHHYSLNDMKRLVRLANQALRKSR